MRSNEPSRAGNGQPLSWPLRITQHKHGYIPWAYPHSGKDSMRFACWISKATDTHSEYIAFISFPQQQ